MIRTRGLGKGIALLALLLCLLSCLLTGTIVLAEGRSPCESIGAGSLSSPAKNPWPCLAKDIGPEDVVSAAPSKPGSGSGQEIKITVAQTLRRLKARCRKGALVDAAGKGIYFYRLQGCWGNPPEGYQEILNQQRSDLERLRKRYRVIEMTCSLSAERIQ